MQLAAWSDIEETIEWWNIWYDKRIGKWYWHETHVINFKLKWFLLEAISKDLKGLSNEIYMWYCWIMEHLNRKKLNAN